MTEPGRRDAKTPPQNWVVAAAFFLNPGEDRWLDDFIDTPDLRFTKVGAGGAAENWHANRGARTTAAGWRGHLAQARAAMARKPDGIVACFPPLSMCVAAFKRLSRHKPKLIAYNYNLGGLPGGPRRWLARAVARQVDLYVVHAPSEVAPYAAYLGLPEDRVRFVPLQRGEITIERREDADAPFALAMGSAHRDYPTLIAAADRLKIPTVIVTRASAIPDLPKSDHVTFKSGLTQRECLELLARARLSVTPIDNQTTASGQITFINAMQLGVPVIATRCPGTDGYVEGGRTGVLVPPKDPQAMAEVMDRLWKDAGARAALGEAARSEARARFSDQAAADTLTALIREITR